MAVGQSCSVWAKSKVIHTTLKLASDWQLPIQQLKGKVKGNVTYILALPLL